MASIAFPAWCLGHDPSAQILSVSYAQDLAGRGAYSLSDQAQRYHYRLTASLQFDWLARETAS
jgi:hypothetical protein